MHGRHEPSPALKPISRAAWRTAPEMLGRPRKAGTALEVREREREREWWFSSSMAISSIFPLPLSTLSNSNPKLRPAPPGMPIDCRLQTSPSPPTMAEILESSRAQGLRLQLRTVGPFFRVQATAAAKKGKDERGAEELGRAEGVIRPWVGGAKVLHLDSIKLSRETVGMDRSIFGLGLFIGAAAVRHGFDQGCTRAELLAINDSPIFHAKLVRFYKRMGFEVVEEVDGSSIRDLGHMLVWGGSGTRMDADIQKLLAIWTHKFKPPTTA